MRLGLRWNFAGRASRVSNDRFREHEAMVLWDLFGLFSCQKKENAAPNPNHCGGRPRIQEEACFSSQREISRHWHLYFSQAAFLNDGNPGQIEDLGDERQHANLAKQREAQ